MRIHLKASAPYGNVVTFASGDLGLIVGLSPGAEADRMASELVKGLSEETWTGSAEVDVLAFLPCLCSAGDAHRGNAGQIQQSPTTSKRQRSAPKAVNNRGPRAGPAPGKLSNRKRSG